MNFKNEVFIISNLTSPWIILVFISASNAVIMRILSKELEENNIKEAVYNLITIIVVLPGIPLIWSVLQEFDSQSNSFLSFYVPLIITILMITTLLNRIVKFIKR